MHKWKMHWDGRESLMRQQLEAARVSTKAFGEKSLAVAKKEAERIENDAEMMGASEIERAKLQLQQELARQSVTMAANFLDKGLTEKDRHKLVLEYVDLVGNGTR